MIPPQHDSSLDSNSSLSQPSTTSPAGRQSPTDISPATSLRARQPIRGIVIALAVLGALTIVYQLYLLQGDAAVLCLVALTCIALVVTHHYWRPLLNRIVSAHRQGEVAQTLSSGAQEATGYWIAARPWIALALSVVALVPIIPVLRYLNGPSSTDEMDRQTSRLLFGITLVCLYLSTWLVVCWIGRRLKLETQSKEKSHGAESLWRKDWKAAPWWAIGFCAVALFLPRPNNPSGVPPHLKDRSTNPAPVTFALQQVRQREATATYWAVAVANFHRVRFETPSGQENAEKYYEHLFQQLQSLTAAARSAPTVNVDVDLVQMATRHLVVEDQILQLRQKLNEYLQQQQTPLPKDSVDERMAMMQLLLQTLEVNPQALERIPPGPERDFIEKGMEIEQLRQVQFREIEIMQATLQERYKGVKFSLPVISQ